MTAQTGGTAPSATLAPQPPGSRDDQPPGGWRLWMLAIRPKTLTISLAPVVVGLALALAGGGAIRWAALAAALAGAVLIQAGTNLWNDLGDALRGGDQPLRQGPPRVTALGWVSPARVRIAALICFGAAALVGLYLARVGGWPVVALGLASLLAGWGYSFGPRPIAYTAWGEVLVVAFFGIGAVAGTDWVLTGGWEWAAPGLGGAVGLPAAAVLMVNNTRDLEHDRLVGRRTLAIRLGPKGAARAYGAMIWAPLFLAMALLPGPGRWALVLAAPWALHLTLTFATTPRGAAFNPLLAATARYQLAVAVLMAAGLLMS